MSEFRDIFLGAFAFLLLQFIKSFRNKDKDLSDGIKETKESVAKEKDESHALIRETAGSVREIREAQIRLEGQIDKIYVLIGPLPKLAEDMNHAHRKIRGLEVHTGLRQP